MKLILFIILILVIIAMTNTNSYGEQVPNWVKNTAGWWSTDSISEKEFINAIEYLVNENIIQVITTESPTESNGIPGWIKNTAGWWSTDSISEKEFINAIEYLIKNGIVSLEKQCSKDIDVNGNNIPDGLESKIIFDPSSDNAGEYVSKITINLADFSNCEFPNELSHYQFYNVDFSNSDLSGTNLFNTRFANSIFHNTDLSNSNLYGALFYGSTLDNVNFENSQFSTTPANFERMVFSIYGEEDYLHCTFIPCMINLQSFPEIETSILEQKIFGKNVLPLNLVREKQILDLSDQRISYILTTSFFFNDIKNVDFQNANLIYSVFGNNDFKNVDLSRSELFGATFYNSNFSNTVFPEGIFTDEFVSLKNDFKMIKKYSEFIPKLNFYTNDLKDLQIKHVIDFPSINWSMGMLIDDENNLIIANTDDHTIDVFSLNDFERQESFTSPIQFQCHTTNAWTVSTNCVDQYRNLPTSIAKIQEKIFVAYGWQNEIQVFDSKGEYLYKFGQKGNNEGEFMGPFQILAWEEKLYVLDSGNNRIQIFDQNYNYEGEFLTNDLPTNDRPVDFSIYDKEVFVAYDLNSDILRFNLEGQVIEEIKLSQHVESESISSIHVNEGLMIISDSSQNQIFVFDLSGEPQMSFGESGHKYGQFMNPQDVVFEDNTIFVSDTYNYRIQIFEIIR